jgi:hypothetical protein
MKAIPSSVLLPSNLTNTVNPNGFNTAALPQALDANGLKNLSADQKDALIIQLYQKSQGTAAVGTVGTAATNTTPALTGNPYADAYRTGQINAGSGFANPYGGNPLATAQAQGLSIDTLNPNGTASMMQMTEQGAGIMATIMLQSTTTDPKNAAILYQKLLPYASQYAVVAQAIQQVGPALNQVIQAQQMAQQQATFQAAQAAAQKAQTTTKA